MSLVPLIKYIQGVTVNFFRALRGFEGVEGTTPGDNPASGRRRIYPKSSGWFDQNSAGVETAFSMSGHTHPAPLQDVVGGRLDYVSATQLAWSFIQNNQIRLHNGTDWEIVELASAPTLANSANDMGGDALTYDVVYDWFIKYVSATSVSIECAKWATATARYAAWVTSTSYKVGQRVSNSGSYYSCLSAHTSGTFATDLANGKWALLEGTDDLLGLGVCDGSPVYANSGDWRKYRYGGVIRLYNDSGAKFKNTTEQCSIANYYNEKPRSVRTYNSTASWSYGTASTRQSNNGTGQIKGEFVLARSMNCLLPLIQFSDNGGAGGIAATSIALDSTSIGLPEIKNYASGFGSPSCIVDATLGIGYHYITTLEYGNGTASTYYGTATYHRGLIGIKA